MDILPLEITMSIINNLTWNPMLLFLSACEFFRKMHNNLLITLKRKSKTANILGYVSNIPFDELRFQNKLTEGDMYEFGDNYCFLFSNPIFARNCIYVDSKIFENSDRIYRVFETNFKDIILATENPHTKDLNVDNIIWTAEIKSYDGFFTVLLGTMQIPKNLIFKQKLVY